MNVVGTVLLTSIENPMCPGCDNYPADPDILRDWLTSLRDCTAVIFHDELTVDDVAVMSAWPHHPTFTANLVEPTDENLFFQRWRLHREWLREATHVEKVWLTDGSDVRMLNPPWEHMEPGVLYVGSEEDTISNQWILANHPSLHDLAAEIPDGRLFNAGLVGGDRETVMRFLRLLCDYMKAPDDMTDMGIFNQVLHISWPGVVATGTPVHTRFGAWAKSNPKAWWAHH